MLTPFGKLVGLGGGLNGNGPPWAHMFKCLVLSGSALWELGSVALLEEMYLTLRFQKHIAGPLLYLMVVISTNKPSASASVPCPAALLPAMVVMDSSLLETMSPQIKFFPELL